MAEWYEQLLEQQLTRNREIWAQLRGAGIGEGGELRLGFVYVAADEEPARELAAFLRAETDYEVDVRPRPGGETDDDGEPEWVVIGATQPTPVSLDLIDDWCEWMIAAGATEGPCAFDGWAAQLVDGGADARPAGPGPAASGEAATARGPAAGRLARRRARRRR
jgi:hypothetical protein